MMVPFRLVVLFFALSSSASAETPNLSDLIAERLSLMRPVAAWKLENDRPVEDLGREAVVLDEASARAAERGIDRPGIRAFFEIQIDAAKEIQNCWMLRWTDTERSDEPVPDLLNEIRPDLLRLGDAIIDAMANDLRNGRRLEAEPEDFDIDCLKPQTAAALSAALSEVKAAGD
ncbi:MAG: gamma subclass chorismate mutase AroQ [Rhodobacteraceae bacterium]|nr:gamma subclass chorismate mutase AroQ [Paracoccaceae bacterium]